MNERTVQDPEGQGTVAAGAVAAWDGVEDSDLRTPRHTPSAAIDILDRAVAGGRIEAPEALLLMREASLIDLAIAADLVRRRIHPEPIVTYIVDRNINYTNVCVVRCSFCAFYRDPGHPEGYLHSKDSLFAKIEDAAFAFAAKDTIANLYGSLALVLDRPFKTGDWIMVGNKVDGDVEEIGMRSTKVRTWPKTVISIPNHVMANEIINNWSRMPKRRVKQIVGVTYETKPDEIEGLVEDLRLLLREDEGVDQDFILVNFTDFAESSLNILVYYFTKSIAWLEHMDVRQRINCKIMRAVESRGLSIAFPTRTVHIEGDIAESLSGRLPGDSGPTMPM